MKIAIIGAGFSGLATAWHLLQSGKCQVTLFDSCGIGGGASGIATGLMHPYPGEDGRRSWRAEEGIRATKELLAVAGVEGEAGILRHLQNDEQRKTFCSHATNFGDVEEGGDFAFITSGITIPCSRYLQGLWEACAQRGAVLRKEQIKNLEELKGFDSIVITAGKGSVTFAETAHLKVNVLKGQLLCCRLPQPFLKHSLIGKGYVAKGEEEGLCYMGSTYERNVSTLDPDPAFAVSEILPKIQLFFPEAISAQVLEARASMRVVRIGHYLPMVGQINDRTWVMTAMGSRGLLYHAYFGKLLAHALLISDPSILPREVCPLFKKEAVGAHS